MHPAMSGLKTTDPAGPFLGGSLMTENPNVILTASGSLDFSVIFHHSIIVRHERVTRRSNNSHGGFSSVAR